MAITDGRLLLAIILNQFIYWSERKGDVDKYILEEKARFEAEGEELNLELSNGWIWKKAEELKEELMVKENPKTISRHLDDLVDLKFLDRRKNPRFKRDRTYQYRVNFVEVVKALKEKGYVLQGYKYNFENEPTSQEFQPTEQNVSPSGENVPPKGENVSPIVENVGALSEITSETTLKITSDNHHLENFSEEKNEIENKDEVVDDELKKSFNNIKLSFKNIKRYSNINDLAAMQEVLEMPLSTPVAYESRTKIIIDVMNDVCKNRKKSGLKGKINSFRYFFNPIKEGFEEYINSKQEKNKEVDQEVFVNEHGTELNFNNFATNK